MIPLVVAALAAVQTLAGVTLGGNVTQVLSKHPGAQQSAKGSSHWWRWSRRGGGTVTVTADSTGNITRVDFVADRGQDNNIDLPCVGAVAIQGPDVNLNSALRKTPCSAFNGAAYGLPDRSVVEVRFEGPGDGQLIEATWYRPSDTNPSPNGHADSVIDYLRPPLKFVGGVARLYYAAECAPPNRSSLFQRLVFPSVWLMPPLQGATGMDSVRQIFRDDPNVTVTQDRSGMPRITIGSVSTELLQSRIRVLMFDLDEQYDALSAIGKISSTADAYANEHGLPFSFGGADIIDHIVAAPVNGAPHLTETMRNITIDDALNSVARTFKGIALYGVCTLPDGKHLFRINFAYGS